MTKDPTMTVLGKFCPRTGAWFFTIVASLYSVFKILAFSAQKTVDPLPGLKIFENGAKLQL